MNVNDGAADQGQGVAPKPSEQSPKWVIWSVVGTFIVLVGGCGVLLSQGSGDGPSQAGLDHDARRVCEDFVKDRLKSPASAEFSEETVTHVGDDYTVSGSVDSQNSFSALVRNTWTCEITSSGDEWRLTSISGLTN